MPTQQRIPHTAILVLLRSLFCCFVLLLSLVHLCFGDSIPVCKDNEKAALLQFKRSLRDPSNRLSSWTAGSDCCGWSGVGCSNRTGHVVRLALRSPLPSNASSNARTGGVDSRLGGEIGPSLLGLRHLAYLDLSTNNFTGRPIPEFLGSLRRLAYLNLSQTGLRGNVPHHLGNLSRLRDLDLSANSAQLALDDAGWVSRLSSLRRLNMQFVQVTPTESGRLLEALNILPFISSVDLKGCTLMSLPPLLSHLNFTSLTFLDLSWNFIQSPFPQWLPNITSLEHLDLGLNFFHGRIPSSMWRMPSLRVLILANTLLQLPRDLTLSSLCKLQTLDMSASNINRDINELGRSFAGCVRNSLKSLTLEGNALSGSFPRWLAEMKRLTRLSLKRNSLQGPIPEFLGRISSLQELDLSMNNFNGSISPNALGTLSRLTTLHLSENHLLGSIPEALGGLSSLESLRLSSNNLIGTIPASLGGLSSLRILDLSNNLSGSIPESFGRLSSLQVIFLHDNNLGGTIPESLGGLSQLRILALTSNNLGGTVSTAHLSNLRSLETLDMAGNPITFKISSGWAAPFNLSIVDLSSCNLGPLFPSWIRLRQSAFRLRLSNAGISDVIPDSYWSSISSIGDLDLSRNALVGRLPDSLLRVGFQYVRLQSNRLEGEVPRLSSIFLDISNNLFTGSIPQDIGKIMPTLRFLSLSNNSLNGSIPGTSLCQLRQLRILDLSRNNLSGDIPDCWKPSSLLYPLEVLNLAHNSLVGAIPNSLGSLSVLQSLQLNDNNLSGQFPRSLRTCSNMSTLDLGENKISGSIPAWLATSMPLLRVLRLRSNNFTGNIPPNFSSLRYLQVIDLANNGLTSTIPTNFGNFTAMKVIHSFGETIGRNRSYPEYYRDVIVVVTKGRMLEYRRLLSLVTSIDLSNNNLSGGLPQGLSSLAGLRNLNISGNMLTGEIMQNISALRWLESLDLSRNNLSGRIPTLMSLMTSLSHLNLSFNNFSGRIPEANQFSTFIDSSIYMGNPYLCGFPLDNPCEDGSKQSDRDDDQGGSEDNKSIKNNVWMYLVTALGFIVGFWAVCGTLILHNRWRAKFSVLIDDKADQLYVFVVLRMRKLKKMIRPQHR